MKHDAPWQTISGHRETLRSMFWQAIRDSLYYTETPMGRAELTRIDDEGERINAFKFWKDAAKRHYRDRADDVASFRAELAQHGWPALMEFDWMKAAQRSTEFLKNGSRRMTPAQSVLIHAAALVDQAMTAGG